MGRRSATAQLSAFVAYMVGRGMAASTCDKYVQDVMQLQRHVKGVAVSKTFALSAVLRGARATMGPAKAKAVLSAEQLMVMLHPLRCDDADSLCLRTAILFQFAGGWRVSSVTANPTLRHTLRLGDVCLYPSRHRPSVVSVWERSSKTVQPGTESPRDTWVGSVPEHPSRCPVAHFVLWLRFIAKYRVLAPDTPLFVMESGYALAADQVNKFLRRRCVELGWPEDLVRSHSLRVSTASNLRVAGASTRAVYHHCGWSLPGENAVAERTYNREGRALVEGLSSQMFSTEASQFARGDPVLVAGAR